VLVGLVVIELNLALHRGELNRLLHGARVLPEDDSIARLHVQEVELNWIVTINVLIREEELLLQQNGVTLSNVLLCQRLFWVQPFGFSGQATLIFSVTWAKMIGVKKKIQ
jgi:hypothetical protein